MLFISTMLNSISIADNVYIMATVTGSNVPVASAPLVMVKLTSKLSSQTGWSRLRWFEKFRRYYMSLQRLQVQCPAIRCKEHICDVPEFDGISFRSTALALRDQLRGGCHHLLHSLEEHMQHLQEVLRRLSIAKLYIKVKKEVSFLKPEVWFLGLRATPAGVSANDDKLTPKYSDEYSLSSQSIVSKNTVISPMLAFTDVAQLQCQILTLNNRNTVSFRCHQRSINYFWWRHSRLRNMYQSSCFIHY